MQQQTYLNDMRIAGRAPETHIMSDFTFCISMYHALERLERHGLRIFLDFFDESDKKKIYLTRNNADLSRCVCKVRDSIEPNPLLPGETSISNAITPGIPEDFNFGHPKYEKLRQHLLQHFNNHKDSKSLVFCEFKDSVYLIYQLLLRNGPLIKPKIFTGKFELFVFRLQQILISLCL